MNSSYTPTPPLSPGTTLQNGEYTIQENTVNAGGFGRIYRAKDRDGHVVALKEFNIQFDNRNFSELTKYSQQYRKLLVGSLIEKFYKEAEALYLLSSRNALNVPGMYSEVFQENGTYYYAMKLVEGDTLREYVEEHGPLSERQAIQFVTQAGKALHEAHAIGLIHCDVSPNNIMIANGIAVLVDFGNARFYDELHLRKVAKEAHLTRYHDYQRARDLIFIENVVASNYCEEEPPIGTIGYMAPEIFGNCPQNDVYGLAATLFYMLTGERPLPEAFSDAHIDESVAQLMNKGVSKTTIKAIALAMEPDLLECTPTIAAFLQQING